MSEQTTLPYTGCGLSRLHGSKDGILRRPSCYFPSPLFARMIHYVCHPSCLHRPFCKNGTPAIPISPIGRGKRHTWCANLAACPSKWHTRCAVLVSRPVRMAHRMYHLVGSPVKMAHVMRQPGQPSAKRAHQMGQSRQSSGQNGT